jgi:hypothetical protein
MHRAFPRFNLSARLPRDRIQPKRTMIRKTQPGPDSKQDNERLAHSSDGPSAQHIS